MSLFLLHSWRISSLDNRIQKLTFFFLSRCEKFATSFQPPLFLTRNPLSFTKKKKKKKKKNGGGGRVQQRSIKTSMGLMERKMGVILERGKDGEACCAAVHGVPKSQTQLSHWIMMETKKGVEGPIQRQNTLPPLWGACCHQNSSNVGSYQGKAYWKEPLSWLAAHVICLGGQVKNLFLPRKDKLTFFLYNLTEYTFLTSDDLEKHIAIFQQRVRVTRTRNLGPGSLCIHTVER